MVELLCINTYKTANVEQKLKIDVNFSNVRIQHQLRCVAPKKQRNPVKFQRSKTSEDGISDSNNQIFIYRKNCFGSLLLIGSQIMFESILTDIYLNRLKFSENVHTQPKTDLTDKVK
ncbi:hypothetical protein T11_1610 [Trichinella zimbabwensis]|uniref:Uncharacterized protein n=1 Tax=Trichinella zimbabwensis TaxID=268475 RepID=A0A0V1I8U8_9BILA|nr:hypothetical protein T11_1610 [Trichinella zimbabwensis]